MLSTMFSDDRKMVIQMCVPAAGVMNHCSNAHILIGTLQKVGDGMPQAGLFLLVPLSRKHAARQKIAAEVQVASAKL